MSMESRGRGFEEAVRAAGESSVAVMVLGESRGMSGEAASRAYLDLPGVQEELLEAVYATGTPIVIVLMNGRPLSISWAAEHIPAIIEAWLPGIQAGNAIADVIFGDYDPGGKLPVTFPYTVGQVPIYYNRKSTGRPPSPTVKWTSKYIDAPYTPLFPFGHGLSYTRFEYSDLEIYPCEVGAEDTVTG
jgi:beta-glucosidase